MTPPQPPPSNGPTSSMPAGVGQDPAPFAETDLFPVLEDGVTPDKRGERSLPLFTAWGPPPPAGAGPTSPTGPSGPTSPTGSIARTTTPAPSNLALVGAAVRSHRSMIVIVALSAALALSCGTLIGVLAFASDGSSPGQQAAAPTASTGPPTSAASAPTSTTGPITTTTVSATSTTSAAAAPSTTGVATAPSAAPGQAPSTAPGPAPDPNALVADFRWSPDPPVAGQSITVVDQSTGAPTRWVWTWNGNVVSSSQPKGFTTSLRQPTAVTLTVCRGSGNSACASVTKVIPVS